MSEELNEVVTGTSEAQVEAPVTPADETPEVKTVTMTQAELDALIGKEKGRVKSKYADYNDLKTKLSTFEQAEKERQEAEMTELEKLQAQLAEKDTKEQTLAQQLADLEKAVQNEKIRNAFNQIATSQNVNHLDDAFVLADLSAVTVEDGKVVGMEDAIKALVDNKPFLLAKKQPKPIGESTNGNMERADKTAEQLLKEAAAKAKASGRIEDKMAYAALKAELNK